MYIPKGKLQSGYSYTKGNEYFLPSTNLPYIGYYHNDTYGNAWTGQTHTNTSIQLIRPPQVSIPDNINKLEASPVKYSQLVPNKVPNLSLYKNNSLPPTQEEYNKTYTTRYIISYKLTSKPVYVDVNKDTYFKMINSPDKQYYYYGEVLWKISGPLYDEKQNNILVKGGVIDSNKRSVQQAQTNIPGVENYLTNLLLYYKP